MFPDKNYTLGSGELYFQPFIPGTRTPAGGQMYFGNTPEFNLGVESETLDHFDADHGIRQKDDAVLLEKNLTGSFITDHISPENLAKWFTGSASVVTQVLAADEEETFTDVIRNRRYQLGVSTANPSGLRGLTTMSAVVGATPLVEGVDIRFDGDTGSFTILAGSTVVTDDGTSDVVVTYTVPAVSYNRIVAGTEARLEGELFFKAFNGKGVQFDYFMPYVQLAPDGDYALKGDDWQQLGFTVEALQRDNDTAVIYTNGRAGVGV